MVVFSCVPSHYRLLALFVIPVLALPAAADAPPCAGKKVAISAAFESKKPDDGFSGIACRDGGTGTRHCLVVDDELQAAQFAELTLDNDKATISPGKTVELLPGDAPPANIVGKAFINVNCKNNMHYEEFDGEAVAWANDRFYVIGSHGCTRKGRFSPSSMFLARFSAEAGPGSIETTYRVTDALLAAAEVKDFFNIPPDRKESGDPEPKGLNIEGMAAIGDRLFVGLRAPEVGENAFIVESSEKALFAAGTEKLNEAPKVVSIKVGKGQGIRDLAVLSGGELLVLTGSGPDCKDPTCSHYAIHRLDLENPAEMRKLWTMTTPFEEKPEGLFVLREDAAGIDAILTYDGRSVEPGGGAVELCRLPN